MRISHETVGEVDVLRVQGKIAIGTGDQMLMDAVREQVEAGRRHIVVNLKDVTAIDSSGVGTLVSLYTMSINRGTRLVLSSLPPKVTDILTITQLITVFDVYDSEAEAIEAVS